MSQTGDFFWNNTQVKVWQGKVEGLRTTFLEPCNGMFWVGCVYGRNDDANRFNFFCNAALEYLRHHASGSRYGRQCFAWLGLFRVPLQGSGNKGMPLMQFCLKKSEVSPWHGGLGWKKGGIQERDLPSTA